MIKKNFTFCRSLGLFVTKRSIFILPSGYKEVARENTAHIIEKEDTSHAFYNPDMSVNRDLTIKILELQNEMPHAINCSPNTESGMNICDAFSSSGVRAIRFGKEIPYKYIKSIYAVEQDPDTFSCLQTNLLHNGLGTNFPIYPVNRDCREFLMENHQKFDFIDIDPFGSPGKFLSSAFHAIKDGGMLAVTATDLRHLCTSPPDSLMKYGAVSFNGGTCSNEMAKAARILLGLVSSQAALQGKCVVPVMYMHLSFFSRVFVRVYSKNTGVHDHKLNYGLVTRCPHCYTIETIPFLLKLGEKIKQNFVRSEDCPTCTTKNLKVCGPAWLGPLFDHSWVTALSSPKMLRNSSEIEKGIVSMLKEELHQPFYFHIPNATKLLKLQGLEMGNIKNALLNAGYKFSRTVLDPQSFRTDAPTDLVWDIFRYWAKEKQNFTYDNSIAQNILAPQIKNIPNFTTNSAYAKERPKFVTTRLSPGSRKDKRN